MSRRLLEAAVFLLGLTPFLLASVLLVVKITDPPQPAPPAAPPATETEKVLKFHDLFAGIWVGEEGRHLHIQRDHMAVWSRPGHATLNVIWIIPDSRTIEFQPDGSGDEVHSLNGPLRWGFHFLNKDEVEFVKPDGQVLRFKRIL